VTDVRRLYEAKPERIGSLFERVGDLVRRARRAIEAGEVSHLGPLMDENQALLRDLTVSSGELDRLCAAAREAGAQGAKLSGGGRGGNMIALVDAGRAEAVSAALCQAGAVNVIHAVVQSP
jgi:mevalonate kinase